MILHLTEIKKQVSFRYLKKCNQGKVKIQLNC